jgi:hypothetical protein
MTIEMLRMAWRGPYQTERFSTCSAEGPGGTMMWRRSVVGAVMRSPSQSRIWRCKRARSRIASALKVSSTASKMTMPPAASWWKAGWGREIQL